MINYIIILTAILVFLAYIFIIYKGTKLDKDISNSILEIMKTNIDTQNKIIKKLQG